MDNYDFEKVGETAEQTKSWIQQHKDHLVTGAIVVLWLKERKTRRILKRTISISTEHAKATVRIAEAVKLLSDQQSVFDMYFGRR